MVNATVYYDDVSEPTNPGWVCETDEDGRPQFALDETDVDATDEALVAEAQTYADGEVTIRRDSINTFVRRVGSVC